MSSFLKLLFVFNETAPLAPPPLQQTQAGSLFPWQNEPEKKAHTLMSSLLKLIHSLSPQQTQAECSTSLCTVFSFLSYLIDGKVLTCQPSGYGGRGGGRKEQLQLQLFSLELRVETQINILYGFYTYLFIEMGKDPACTESGVSRAHNIQSPECQRPMRGWAHS